MSDRIAGYPDLVEARARALRDDDALLDRLASLDADADADRLPLWHRSHRMPPKAHLTIVHADHPAEPDGTVLCVVCRAPADRVLGRVVRGDVVAHACSAGCCRTFLAQEPVA